MDFIERIFGISPDAGSGMVESAFTGPSDRALLDRHPRAQEIDNTHY